MANEAFFHLGVKALIQNHHNQYLLLKVNLEQLKGFQDEPYWDIPGGRVKEGVGVEDTLHREVEEETGITSISSLSFFHAVVSNIRIPIDKTSVGLILFTYICYVDKFPPIKISDEHTAYDWFYADEASRLLKIKYPDDFTEKLRALGKERTS